MNYLLAYESKNNVNIELNSTLKGIYQVLFGYKLLSWRITKSKKTYYYI